MDTLQLENLQLSAVTVCRSYSCLQLQFAEITVNILHLSAKRLICSGSMEWIFLQNSWFVPSVKMGHTIFHSVLLSLVIWRAGGFEEGQEGVDVW